MQILEKIFLFNGVSYIGNISEKSLKITITIKHK